MATPNKHCKQRPTKADFSAKAIQFDDNLKVYHYQ